MPGVKSEQSASDPWIFAEDGSEESNKESEITAYYYHPNPLLIVENKSHPAEEVGNGPSTPTELAGHEIDEIELKEIPPLSQSQPIQHVSQAETSITEQIEQKLPLPAEAMPPIDTRVVVEPIITPEEKTASISQTIEHNAQALSDKPIRPSRATQHCTDDKTPINLFKRLSSSTPHCCECGLSSLGKMCACMKKASCKAARCTSSCFKSVMDAWKSCTAGMFDRIVAECDRKVVSKTP